MVDSRAFQVVMGGHPGATVQKQLQEEGAMPHWGPTALPAKRHWAHSWGGGPGKTQPRPQLGVAVNRDIAMPGASETLKLAP